MIAYSIIQKSKLEGALRLDAEYYQPEYLGLEQKLRATYSWKLWKDIEGRFITGPFGSEFNVENYVLDREFRYVRGKDVKNLFLLDDDNVYVSRKDYERLNKYSLKEGDILISVVGTLGNSVIVDRSVLPAIFSCKSTAFRSEAINPYYFIAYLNSHYGRNLLKRSVRGAIQTGLNIYDLKSLLVFVPSKGEQEFIASLVCDAKQSYDNSKFLYSKAENSLLGELGLRDFQIKKDLSYVFNLSNIKSAHRVDAEYFHPKYDKLISIIKNHNAKSLLDVFENVKAAFNPKTNPSKIFQYVELANINSSIGVIDGYSIITGEEAPGRAKRVLESGDVIVSSIEGSLGKVALVNQEQDGYLASNGFFQFRSKDIVLPEVLLVIAKSIVLQMQLQKQTTGSILTAVPKDALKNVVIPVLPENIQQNITNLVQQSHEARKKAKKLLEEAKKKVEEEIEKC